MKKAVKLIVGILLAALFLALSLRGVDTANALRNAMHASWGYMLASVAVGLFGHNLLRAWRWRVMLTPEKPGIGLYNLFSTTVIGYAASWSLPLRVGEFLRPVLLAEREGIRASAALTTVLIERFLDGLAIVALSAVAVMTWNGREGIGPEGEAAIRYAGWGGAVVLCGSALLFGLLIGAAATKSRWEGRVESFAARSKSRLLASAARGLVGLVEGGTILRRPAGLALTAVLSVAVWMVIGYSVWLGLKSAGIEITYPEVFILMPASVLGIGIPTPGGAGSYEYLVSRALQYLFNQPLDTAYAATLILHVLITLLPTVLLGSVLLWRDGVSIARLKSTMAAAAGGSP